MVQRRPCGPLRLANALCRVIMPIPLTIHLLTNAFAADTAAEAQSLEQLTKRLGQRFLIRR